MIHYKVDYKAKTITLALTRSELIDFYAENSLEQASNADLFEIMCSGCKGYNNFTNEELVKEWEIHTLGDAGSDLDMLLIYKVIAYEDVRKEGELESVNPEFKLVITVKPELH